MFSSEARNSPEAPCSGAHICDVRFFSSEDDLRWPRRAPIVSSSVFLLGPKPGRTPFRRAMLGIRIGFELTWACITAVFSCGCITVCSASWPNKSRTKSLLVELMRLIISAETTSPFSSTNPAIEYSISPAKCFTVKLWDIFLVTNLLPGRAMVEPPAVIAGFLFSNRFRIASKN